MRSLFAIIISGILATLCCGKAFADVSYADLFLAGRGYKPVEDIWTEKPIVTYAPDGSIPSITVNRYTRHIRK
ncbi:MAG: hypothetical protein DWB57_12150 [Candidatus Brocadia sp.]|nr:hypothetical protein [Candidatus Brocadia sp.]